MKLKEQISIIFNLQIRSGEKCIAILLLIKKEPLSILEIINSLGFREKTKGKWRGKEAYLGSSIEQYLATLNKNKIVKALRVENEDRIFNKYYFTDEFLRRLK